MTPTKLARFGLGAATSVTSVTSDLELLLLLLSTLLLSSTVGCCCFQVASLWLGGGMLPKLAAGAALPIPEDDSSDEDGTVDAPADKIRRGK